MPEVTNTTADPDPAQAPRISRAMVGNSTSPALTSGSERAVTIEEDWSTIAST